MDAKKAGFEFLSPIPGFHVIKARLKRRREVLFHDFGSLGRGLTARQDYCIRFVKNDKEYIESQRSPIFWQKPSIFTLVYLLH